MPDAVTRLNAALEGRYRIVRGLGEGGMATVYLADDLRHERKVALKVLKPELAAVVGAERFLAEIKTTANLRHPHILPLFDSGAADGFLFYVMPYVEGESLREKLDRERQLPVDEAVRIATNIAEALGHAHRQGVIHRDIKPANILLQDGKPVVSDFGIALAVSAGGAGRLTETGLSLGTPHYMSPEQATGDHTVGPATDIYGLGCVLYEMLVSEPPYTGGTPQAVLGKIVTSDPEPVTKHRRAVPINVDAAVRRALEKVPADRFAGAVDFARALGDRGFTHGEAAGVAGVRFAWNRLSVGLAALAALTTGLAAWGWLARPVVEPAVTTRAEIVGLDLEIPNGGWRLAISPDGRWIVAGHREEGLEPALYVRSSSSTQWQRLPNTEMATNPSFSPDGQWIAFEIFNEGIFKVPVAGGTRLPVVAPGGAPHWTEDDQIVYGNGNEILTVPASGGEPQLLLRSDSVSHRRPHLLPNGRAIVFGTGSASVSRVMLYDLGTGELRELSPTGNQPRYVPTGHLLFGGGDGSLMAVRFNLGTLATVGSPVTVLASLSVYAGGASQFAVSDNGTLVYEAAFALSAERRLVWVDRNGSEQLIDAAPQEYTFPRVSPDGRRAAVSVPRGDGGADIYVWSFINDNGIPLFLGQGVFSYPVWSRDGTRITYSAASGGIYAKAANNTGTAELLLQVETGGDARRQPSAYFFAPTERAIVYREQANPETDDDLVMWSLEGDSVIWRLDGPFVERNAVLSPNGRWMAYQSNESGQTEVYVRPFPNVHDDLVTISNAGGYDPVWSWDGRELFYLGEIDLLAVSVDPDASSGSFAFGDRRVLMPWPYFVNSEGRNFDVGPNGRFLAVDAREDAEQSVYIITNWFEELRELVGN